MDVKKDYQHYTKARILLGNHGAALPTKAWLHFLYNHAEAKDALFQTWDHAKNQSEIKQLGLVSKVLSTLAKDLETYLKRPDFGRCLDEESKKQLQKMKQKNEGVLIALSNGLSGAALNNHAGPLLAALTKHLSQMNIPIFLNTIFLIKNARVAVVDAIGSILKPKAALLLIGERPGLQSPDSLSIYLTYEPKPNRTDAERNCISNIRVPDGLSYEMAAQKTAILIKQSLHLKLSGIGLKEYDGLTE